MAEEGFTSWQRWECPTCGVKTIRALTYWSYDGTHLADDVGTDPQWRLHCTNGHEVEHEPLTFHTPMVAR